MRPVDIEGELVTVLDGLVDDIGTSVPNPRPASLIRVTRAGGNSRNPVQSDVRMLVECWAPDEVAAFDLASAAYSRILDHYGPAGVWGGRANLSEPVNFPDPETTSPRYQFVASILTDLEVTA